MAGKSKACHELIAGGNKEVPEEGFRYFLIKY